jgi:hypothetical protein
LIDHRGLDKALANGYPTQAAEKNNITFEGPVYPNAVQGFSMTPRQSDRVCKSQA